MKVGEYVLGAMIVPQTYKKVVLADDGTIKAELFSVSSRKIPLSEIRERVLKEHEDLGLIHAQTDEYYTALTQDQVYNTGLHSWVKALISLILQI